MLGVRVRPEHGHGLTSILLDRRDALRVALGPPERHRLAGGLTAKHRTCLRDPVGDELGDMRPDLAPIPPLAAVRISTGERPVRRLRCCRGREPRFHGVETCEVRVAGTHRSGRNDVPATTRLRSVPSRSTLSSTTSPGCNQGY